MTNHETQGARTDAALIALQAQIEQSAEPGSTVNEAAVREVLAQGVRAWRGVGLLQVGA